MSLAGGNEETKALAALIGEWSMEVKAEWAPGGDQGARCTFEWLDGETFLIQRWSVPVPEAPNGIALIGWDERRGTLLQHYFDSRGVARVYEMMLEDGVWSLERTKPDFSEFEFAQRYSGKLSDDGALIEGTWEIAHDKETFEKDFDLVYRKLG